jgi:hypothetical protein
MSGGGGGGGDTRPTPVQPIPIGKGGSGLAGSGSGGSGSTDPCDIVEETNVNSINRSVLVTVQVGNILQVEKEGGPPVRLLVKTAPGAVLGSITSPMLAQILACIDAGHDYSAEVTSIAGGAVRVVISRT